MRYEYGLWPVVLFRVALQNMSMEAQPMHLHGQSFKVLAVNDVLARIG